MNSSENRPVTLDQVQPLWEAGKSRAEIARALHTSGYYVDRVAKPAGLAWDRAQTIAATTARIVDATAQRVALSEAMREMAAEGIYMAMNRKATAADRKAGAVIAGIGAQRDIELARFAREQRHADQEEREAKELADLLGDPFGRDP